MKIRWTTNARKQLLKIPLVIAERIIKKMDWYVQQKDPLHFAKPLTDTGLGSHRFRIGDYRILCTLKDEDVQILHVESVRKRDEKTYK